jgi:cysteinyl-tRNA synthetase, unknown class
MISKLGFTLISFLLIFTSSNTLQAATRDLNTIKSWGYLLQNVTVSKVANSPFELVVIEPQLESDADRVFDRYSLKVMRKLPDSDNPRIILAYISIGEAEDYRSYWKSSWNKSPPDWLGKVNPDWEGNYKVRFWDSAWQKIILKQIDAILISGFDGIYLDIVDAWEYWGDESTYKKRREDQKTDDPRGDYSAASKKMLDWLSLIENHVHQSSSNSRSDFMVFPQNGEFLITHLDKKDRNRFWEIVDGIGVESVFFYGDREENNSLNMEKSRLEILSQFRSRGKTVLSVEYISRSSLIKKYLPLSKIHGFVPYTGPRQLDKFSHFR